MSEIDGAKIKCSTDADEARATISRLKDGIRRSLSGNCCAIRSRDTNSHSMNCILFTLIEPEASEIGKYMVQELPHDQKTPPYIR